MSFRTNRRLVRFAAAAASAAVVTIGATGVAPAMASSGNSAKGGCPADGSPWELTTQKQWLDMSVSALEEVFGTMKKAASALGFSSERELRSLILSNFGSVNSNGDAYICVSQTNPGGIPDYAFLVDDNKFNAKHVG